MTSQPHSPEKVKEYETRQRNQRHRTGLERLLEKLMPDQPAKRIPLGFWDALAGKQLEEES
jgi:hypothetical protein